MRIALPSNIRSKLILLAVLAFLPVLLITICNFISRKNADVEEANRHMERILKFAVLHEEEVIRRTHRMLAALAESPELGDSGTRADRILSDFLKGCPEYANLGIARLDGRVTASAVRSMQAVNVSDRIYFRGAVENRSFTVGEYQVGRITGKAAINFGYPRKDRHGNVAAVVFAALDLSRVTEFETEIGDQIPEGASYVKLDGGGAIVSVHPKSRAFVAGQFLDQSLFATITKEEKGMVRSTGEDGVERLILFSRFRSPLRKDGGSVFLAIQTGTLFAPATREFRVDLAALFALGGGYLAIIWLGGTALIVRPLGVLVGTAKRLAGGDLAVRSGLGPADGELGQLGRAFDDMAVQLHRRHDDSRAMQESLRETSDYLENLLRYANAPIIVWDPAFRITRFNGAFERLTGFAAGDVVGRELNGLFPEQSREDTLSRIGRTSGGERLESVEIPVLCRNGETRIVLWNSAGIYARDGATLIATIAQGQDITGRKHAENALQASESKYRLLIENASEAIFILQGGFVRYSNPTTGRTTGHSAERLGSTTFITLVHPEDRQLVIEKQERRLQAGGPPETYSFRIRNSAGEELWLALNSAVIQWEGAPATLNFARDITLQKKLERELLASQRMEAVGRLAGGVAHDFNNLLTVILGYSEILRARFPAGEAHHREVDEIQKAAELARNLTGQLLAFSRKQILRPQVININEVVSGMEKLIRRLIGEDIDVVTRLGAGLWNIKADRGQIEQVVMNITVNARDAMPKGGKVTIETANVTLDDEYRLSHPSVQPGDYAVIAISDTGQGMDRETASKVFEPFFTTKERGKGTGLGLSTVYGIVKQSGGFIWVYSEPGEGATFKVCFPRTDEREDAVETPPRAVEDLRGTGTVLIAEDEESIRKLAGNILARHGYTVLSAGDGEEALRMAAAHPGEIGLLLTDVVMPRMGGKGLYDRLRQLRPGIRVLYMSGYTEDTIVHHGVLDTGIDFLPKPYSPMTLVRKVKEILSRK